MSTTEKLIFNFNWLILNFLTGRPVCVFSWLGSFSCVRQGARRIMSIYHSRVEIKFLCPLLQSFGHKNNFISPKKLTRSLRSLVRFNGEIKLFLCPHSFSRGHKNFISPRSWYIATFSFFIWKKCECRSKIGIIAKKLWKWALDMYYCTFRVS